MGLNLLPESRWRSSKLGFRIKQDVNLADVPTFFPFAALWRVNHPVKVDFLAAPNIYCIGSRIWISGERMWVIRLWNACSLQLSAPRTLMRDWFPETRQIASWCLVMLHIWSTWSWGNCTNSRLLEAQSWASTPWTGRVRSKSWHFWRCLIGGWLVHLNIPRIL